METNLFYIKMEEDWYLVILCMYVCSPLGLVLMKDNSKVITLACLLKVSQSCPYTLCCYAPSGQS